MTTALDQVTVDAKCLVQTCEKQGCSVDLADLPKPFRLIDMDHPASPAKGKGARCDYLFIGVGKPNADDLRIVPLELKSSPFSAKGVSKQLARGAKMAERVVPGGQRRFVPVVVHEGTHRRQIQELAKHPVTFRGSKYIITSLPCGASLSEVL